MSPYLRAWQTYHARGVPVIPWPVVLDFHHQAGVVISEARCFVMARPVPEGLTAEEELSLSDFGLYGMHGGTWHVWAAAGDLRQMLKLMQRYAIETLSFQRRGFDRLHRRDGWRFVTKAAALCPPHNPGE